MATQHVAVDYVVEIIIPTLQNYCGDEMRYLQRQLELSQICNNIASSLKCIFIIKTQVSQLFHI